MTCTNGVCVPSPCMNGKQDGDETDVDCGGATCGPCLGGKMCLLGTDCVGMICTNNVCKSALMCMAGTGDCDGNAGNGCEVNTTEDARNCGGCGRVCPVNTPRCINGACSAMPAPIGSFAVEDNPNAMMPSPTYSCQEACAKLFGGMAAQYSCSTKQNSIDHQAWVTGWGDPAHCVGGAPVAESFKKGNDYFCGAPGCAYSAYQRDHCRKDLQGSASTNYCFK